MLAGPIKNHIYKLAVSMYGVKSIGSPILHPSPHRVISATFMTFLAERSFRLEPLGFRIGAPLAPFFSSTNETASFYRGKRARQWRLCRRCCHSHVARPRAETSISEIHSELKNPVVFSERDINENGTHFTNPYDSLTSPDGRRSFSDEDSKQ